MCMCEEESSTGPCACSVEYVLTSNASVLDADGDAEGGGWRGTGMESTR